MPTFQSKLNLHCVLWTAIFLTYVLGVLVKIPYFQYHLQCLAAMRKRAGSKIGSISPQTSGKPPGN